MQARYSGTCAGGRDPINPGQTIVRDGRGWSHPSHVRADRPTWSRPASYAQREADAARMRGSLNGLSNAEVAEARRQRQLDEQEYAAGREDADRWRFNRDMFGESYAAAEEYARDLRGLNGDW